MNVERQRITATSSFNGSAAVTSSRPTPGNSVTLYHCYDEFNMLLL
jgi:hypothetical protein